MKFTPISAEDAKSFSLLEKGEYDFVVIVAEEKQSNAGNDMFALELDVFGHDGRKVRVYDYLVLNEKSSWKLRHFAESVKMLTEYEKGEIEADSLVSRSGKCSVGIKVDKKGEYPDKNIVLDYVPADNNMREPGDDDLPDFKTP